MSRNASLVLNWGLIALAEFLILFIFGTILWKGEVLQKGGNLGFVILFVNLFLAFFSIIAGYAGKERIRSGQKDKRVFETFKIFLLGLEVAFLTLVTVGVTGQIDDSMVGNVAWILIGLFVAACFDVGLWAERKEAGSVRA